MSADQVTFRIGTGEIREKFIKIIEEQKGRLRAKSMGEVMRTALLTLAKTKDKDIAMNDPLSK